MDLASGEFNIGLVLGNLKHVLAVLGVSWVF